MQTLLEVLRKGLTPETVKGLHPLEKSKKVIKGMKDELGGKLMKEFTALRPKMYCYVTDDRFVDKKAKGTKKCIIKLEIKFGTSKSVRKVVRCY